MKKGLRLTGHPVWNCSIFFLFLLVINASASTRLTSDSEQFISGQRIFTWDKVAGNEVTEAGVTIPFSVIDNPPTQPGTGPAGAIAVVYFSQKVRDTTFLNHFELNWEKHGHAPPVFTTPHFDFHFYTIPSTEVMTVSQPDPMPPMPDRIPSGYIYPGAEFTINQMGVHAVRPTDLEKPFTDVLIFGFYGGRMTFIEPMVTQATLLKQNPISYAVPVPAAMGRVTRFPTKFRIEHDLQTRSCHLVFSDFVATAP